MAHNSPESHASNIIGTEKDNNKPMTHRRTYTWKEAFDDALGGAEDGLPPYRTFVGYCYDVGKGTKRDLKRAIYWYTKAAANGSTAQCSISRCATGLVEVFGRTAREQLEAEDAAMDDNAV